jgi:tetratricopeptide (TPR) repeat protein
MGDTKGNIMRPTRHVTAVLVLAALAAVGCSKRSEAPKSESKDSSRVKPATPPIESLALKQTDDKALAANAAPKDTLPASFADGEAAYRGKKYTDATGIFERYVAERPDHAPGHYMLGLSAWKGNDLAKAEKAFDAALAIDPDHVKSLVNKGRVLIEQKRCDEAIALLTRASEIEPESGEVHRLLGRAHHVQGQPDAAVEAYRRAIDLDERDVWAMNNLGLVLMEQQRADEALPLLVEAVALRKDVPAFHNNLGMALEHAGRFKAAAAAYKDALTADPAYDKAKQNLARVEAVKAIGEEPEVDTVAKSPAGDTRIATHEKKPGQ